MKGSEKKRRKLNRLGMITLSSFILFISVLTYFIWVGIAEKNAEAGKNIKMPTKVVETLNPIDKQSDKIEGKTNIVLDKDQTIDNEENNAVPDDKAAIEEIKKHEQELEKHDQDMQKHNEKLDQHKKDIEKHEQEIKQQQNDVEKKNEDTKQEQKSEDPAKEKPSGDKTNNEQPKGQAPAGKVVYLTFDDGPHAVSKDILSLLKKYNAKATFFMLEPNMRNYPDAVKAMVNEGHTVGVHGVTHQVSKIYRSPASFVGEMNQAIAFIQKTTNMQTHLIRAPYGSKPYVTDPFKAAADKEKMILWDWNIDSMDWKLTNGQYVDKVIQQTKQFKSKEPLIVLMHEKPTTLANLEKLLKYYKDNGYEMKAIDEIMTPVQFK